MSIAAMHPLQAFTLGFIACGVIAVLMVIASDRWKLWPKARPLFAPRTQRVLLEVPFLDLRKLYEISAIVLGPAGPAIGSMYWSHEPQPDERIRLVVTLERFGPGASK